MRAVYRIYTEDLQEDKIAEIVSCSFEGFTIYHANGYWNGVAEKSLIIEIIGDFDEEKEKRVNRVARSIKRLNHQECVLIQKFHCESFLL